MTLVLCSGGGEYEQAKEGERGGSADGRILFHSTTTFRNMPASM